MAKILLLCWRDSGHPQGGGSEHYLEVIGQTLAKRGDEVLYRTAKYPGARRLENVGGMTVSRAGNRFTVYPRALMSIIAAHVGLGSLRHLGKPDVIVDTQNGIPFFARLVTNTPVVLLEHHCHREQWPVAGRILSRLGWFLESRISPWVHRACCWITVSSPSKKELIELGVKPVLISIVHNGTDAIPEGLVLSEQSPTPRLITVSRLVPHKRIEHAIDVLAAVRKNYPDASLDIVGDGWWKKELSDYAQKKELSDAVTFHGHVSENEKHRLLEQAWVLLMPSQKEGWGLAVVEAAQHSRPSLGYRSSAGLTDSIIDGETGVIVDSKEELCDATTELLTNSLQREKLGKNARIRAQQFLWADSATKFRSVLEKASQGSDSSS